MSDIDLLEQDKIGNDPLSIPSRPYSTPSLSRDLSDLTIGQPQKITQGRDTYYTFPLKLKSSEMLHHRYSDFVWLQQKLASDYPGCVTTSLPQKQGLYAYWGSQDPMFLSFRRFGLQKFLKRISQHPKLSQSPDFISFLEQDQVFFKSRMKKTENKTWMGAITQWGNSVSSMVQQYVYGDQLVLQNEGDHTFNQYRNEIKSLYQQQVTLCEQGREMVQNSEAEIQSNFGLAKAYQNMGKVQNQGLAQKLKVMAEAHQQIGDLQKENFHKVKALVGFEMEDYRRYTLGLIETFDRRNKMRCEQNQGKFQVDMDEVNQDLKADLESFNNQKKFLSQAICNQLIAYKQDLTEKISEVWREAYNKIIG